MSFAHRSPRRMRTLLVLGVLAVAVSLHAAHAAVAPARHGGGPVPPPPPKGPPASGKPTGPAPPTAPPPPTTGGKPGTVKPGDAPSGAGASKPATTGGGRAAPASGTGAGRGARPPLGGGRAATGTGGGTGFALSDAPDPWEQWWHDNQDRFLDLRAQLVFGGRESTAQGPLTGMGRPPAGRTRRATDAVVSRDILPVLFEQLAHGTEPEILDSALIALGRCAPDEDAERLLQAARPLLAHDVLSVQTSAVLALGIQGSPSYVPLLGHLMADTSTGRAAVGGGSVPTPVRALAALSLGLGNHPAGVPMLADLAVSLPDAERDLKVCAMTALGLTRNEAGDDALGVLRGLLFDGRLDSLLKAHVPLAIARLDDGAHAEAVPVLLSVFGDPDTDDAVRTACATALGRLASAADRPCVQLLSQAATEARHERTRHASLMALAEIGRRDLPNQDRHAELHEELAQRLDGALAEASAPGDRAWAALSIGIYVRDGAAHGPGLIERLAWTYRQQKDPSQRGAFALALGLAGAADAVPEIVEDFRAAGDERLRGYAAVALGLLDARDAVDSMLACCADKSVPSGLREQVAVGLALLREPEVVPSLIDVLEQVEVHPVSVSVARALGRIGDREAIGSLARIARDEARQPSTRGMACVALGLLGERTSLPWNAQLKETRLHEARVDALDLVLDIL